MKSFYRNSLIFSPKVWAAEALTLRLIDGEAGYEWGLTRWPEGRSVFLLNPR